MWKPFSCSCMFSMGIAHGRIRRFSGDCGLVFADCNTEKTRRAGLTRGRRTWRTMTRNPRMACAAPQSDCAQKRQSVGYLGKSKSSQRFPARSPFVNRRGSSYIDEGIKQSVRDRQNFCLLTHPRPEETGWDHFVYFSPFAPNKQRLLLILINLVM